ncbi:MAG: carbon-nitrogen hydrolase family protein [Bacillota bacterium]
MEKILVALCQLHVTPDKDENLEKAAGMVRTAAAQGAHLVILPEMFNTPISRRYMARNAEPVPGPVSAALSQLARECGIVLVGGSFPESDGSKVYNTSLSFDKRGQQICHYRKIHLFDVDLPGGVVLRESDTVSAGSRLGLIDTELGRLGIGICYDLRFPELWLTMALRGTQIMAVPAAFNVITGTDHWHTVLKSRAMDCQTFFAVASPARDQKAPFIPYGHSLVADPWGNILAEAGEGEELVLAEIDLKRIAEVRARLPLLEHRRNEVYRLEWLGD